MKLNLKNSFIMISKISSYGWFKWTLFILAITILVNVTSVFAQVNIKIASLAWFAVLTVPHLFHIFSLIINKKRREVFMYVSGIVIIFQAITYIFFPFETLGFYPVFIIFFIGLPFTKLCIITSAISCFYLSKRKLIK